MDAAAGGAPLSPEWLRAALMRFEPRARASAAATRVARAPGRVNLIGEHTDYNDGFVMPVAIDLETWIAYLPTAERSVRLTLVSTGESDGFELDSVGPPRSRWIDYVAGVAWALSEAGLQTSGLVGVIAGSLPAGAGLASSAALELAAAWALCADRPPGMPPLELAQACQRAENEYVGVASGLMDQFASSVGSAEGGLLLDCRSLQHRSVPLPAEHALVVCHSGSPRRLEASAYNQRRQECQRAVALIRRRRPLVRSLRDVSPELLLSLQDELEPLAFRRARHVVSENERVLACEAALRDGRPAEVGRLWAQSHASLRDDYEVSSNELDALVEIAAATPGVVASRLTGAGFGGCTVNLVRREAVDGLRSATLESYPRRTGLQPRVWQVEPAPGAGIVEA